MHQRFCQLGVVYRSIGDDGCSSLLLILSWCMRRVEQDEDEDEDEDDEDDEDDDDDEDG